MKNIYLYLGSEIFTCLLVQWPSNCHCEQGKVLSKFHSSLDQLIYPASDSLNNNLELLMEPSAIFPVSII